MKKIPMKFSSSKKSQRLIEITRNQKKKNQSIHSNIIYETRNEKYTHMRMITLYINNFSSIAHTHSRINDDDNKYFEKIVAQIQL